MALVKYLFYKWVLDWTLTGLKRKPILENVRFSKGTDTLIYIYLVSYNQVLCRLIKKLLNEMSIN